MSEENKHVRQIEVNAEATTIKGWKKQVVAGQLGQKQFTFLSDEGAYMPGGESSAPTPLTYFVSGVALWLLSQVSQVAAKKRLTLRNERVKVIAHFREEGSVLTGTQNGICEDFSIELSIEGDMPQEEITTLIRLAHRMCFTESALSNVVKITPSHVFNGQPLELE